MSNVAEELGINLEGSIAFAPTWSAHNAEAKLLVDDVLTRINYVPTGIKTDAKYRTVVASILALSSVVLVKNAGVLALSKDRSTWTPYAVGMDTILKVFNMMEVQGLIGFMPDSGKRIFYGEPNDNGKQKWQGVLSQYCVNDALFELEGYHRARWVETGTPPVMVGKPETRGALVTRKKMGLKKPKLAITAVKKTFGRDYARAATGVKLLGTYWQAHPLELPSSDTSNLVTPYAASATRIYHNGRMDSGVRYYGAWTNKSSKQRLSGSIDDEPLVEIDLNAAQPTLFSALMGHTMEVENTWTDLYGEIIRNLGGSATEETKRKKLKQCVVEVIGTGNIAKTHPALDTGVTWEDQGEWDIYRATLLYHVPALGMLDAKYYNGSGFVSYHESQVMTEVLHDLMARNVVAYPIHDCLLVKKSDQEIALEAYRTILRNYILRFNRINNTDEVNITFPVSVEELDKVKVRVAGSYNCYN